MVSAVNGIDVANLDRSISPAHNFYRFANGGWLSRNPIPGEYSRWGAFEELHEMGNSQLRQILEECVQDESTTDPNRIAVGILYATGMDEDACEKHGLAPMKDVFEHIDNIKEPHEVLLLSATLRSQLGITPGLFGFYSIPDAKNSSWEVMAVSQSGSLGIGDRDFYFRDDKKEIREKYVKHVANMLSLCGFCNEQVAEEKAKQHMDLEIKIATSCRTKTEMRDPLKTYNKFEGVEDLVERTKSDEGKLPWAQFFKLLGLPEEATKTIIVDNPGFFVNLTKLLFDVDMETWKIYTTYHVMKRMARYLPTKVEEEQFSFFGTTMTGQPEMKPRWKRVLNSGVTDLLEHCLGILYTDRHFSSLAKTACLEMVNVLTDVLLERIDNLEWMQPETKEKAKQKLAKFRPMIGYPDKWEVDDIPELIKKLSMKNSYATNARACMVREFELMIKRIDKPVDPNRWEMPPTMVNAYFHPLKNVIVFPAAILQPPFFFHPSTDAPYGDPAVNFSAIGAVICHEISHGYDDQGRKFDSNGELVDWWTREDAEEYERRAANMEKLCSDYKIFDKNLNGKLCLGENIADYGGVKLAFAGLNTFMEKHGRLPDMDGFTPEQRFFLGWAAVWRNNIREENALQRIIMDPHAPGEFRANIVQVIDDFHTAFDIKDGDPMYQPPEARCEIW
ncbi:Neprilysin metalloprotease (M13) [Gracilaria domingensis]|nr:Neprilysin metalloprotease (M13) [Gracilaria domingensis]